MSKRNFKLVYVYTDRETDGHEIRNSFSRSIFIMTILTLSNLLRLNASCTTNTGLRSFQNKEYFYVHGDNNATF